MAVFMLAATMVVGWSGRKKPLLEPVVKKFEPVPWPPSPAVTVVVDQGPPPHCVPGLESLAQAAELLLFVVAHRLFAGNTQKSRVSSVCCRPVAPFVVVWM